MKWHDVQNLNTITVQRNPLPVGRYTYVMHVELNGFGLFLVFEMIVSQQVVNLIDDWWCRGSVCRKRGGLKEIKIKHFRSHDSQQQARGYSFHFYTFLGHSQNQRCLQVPFCMFKSLPVLQN